METFKKQTNVASTPLKFRTPQSSLRVGRLRARNRPGLSIEFVSTLISGPLPSIDLQDGESRPEGESADSTDALPVAVLDGGGCNLPTREVGKYTERHMQWVGGAIGRTAC